MENNQIENRNVSEPNNSFDNSEQTQMPDNSAKTEGQSADKNVDPSSLILGKFKTQDDLVNAYQQLEKLQGAQSAELGVLRGNASMMHQIQEVWAREEALRQKSSELQELFQKYNTPEYFQDPSFKMMFKEAFLALGDKLDTDKFVNLLEGYVSSRLMHYQQTQAAKNETENALGSVKFNSNKNTSFKKPGKRIDEMTPQEIDELLDKYL